MKTGNLSSTQRAAPKRTKEQPIRQVFGKRQSASEHFAWLVQ
jgi:hypothetical protein